MPRLPRLRIAIPALVVLLVTIAGAAQLWGQHQARMNLDRMLASLPPGYSGRYAGLTYNVFTRTLRVRGVAISRDGRPSLSIGRAVVHHLAGSGSAADPFRAEAFLLERMTLWRGRRSLTIAVANGRGVAVLATGQPPPADTPRWLIAPGSGTLLALGSLTASGLADDRGATLAAFSLQGYRAGRLQQARIAGFADRDGNRITTADAEEIDLGGLDRVFDTGRYGPGAAGWTVPRTLIGHAAISGLATEGAHGGATTARMTLAGFAARPFATSPNTTHMNDPAFDRDAAKAIAVESFGLSGLRFSDTATKTTGAIGALTVAGYSDGDLAHAALDHLAITGQATAALRIGHLGLTGLSARKLLYGPMPRTLAELLDMARNGAVTLAGVALSRVSVAEPGAAPITLGNFTDRVTGRDPIERDLRIEALSIPAKANAELGAEIGMLGLDRLVIDLDADGSYSAASGAVAVRNLVMAARGLGRLSFAGTFANVPPDLFKTMSGKFEAVTRIGIGPFTLRFNNEMLLQRLFALEAQQSGKTTAQVASDAKLAASFMAAGLVPGQQDAGAVVAAFIDDPKQLTITAEPAAPVPLSDLLGQDLSAARSALNLHLAGD